MLKGRMDWQWSVHEKRGKNLKRASESLSWAARRKASRSRPMGWDEMDCDSDSDSANVQFSGRGSELGWLGCWDGWKVVYL